MAERPARAPYSYRADPAVPAFPDDKPVFVFDGICVLCSSGARWLMAHDEEGRFRFATAQSPLGQALYRHYGITIDETYLLIDRGQVFRKSAGYLRMLGVLGGAWNALRIFHLVPRPLRDAVYDMIARNRYRWFGKTGYCALIPPSLNDRLLR
jgi:predicted DCC family thiol-disulfide oxidoreductase YuxK